MATKKKATKRAPTSKAPASKKPKAKEPVVRKDGQPTRAERKAANKAEYNATLDAGKKVTAEIIATAKDTGKQASALAMLKKPQVEWTEELGQALFSLIATGHGMKEIAEMDGMPPLFQMLKWLGEKTHPFSDVRARAKELLVPLYEELAQSVALNTNTAILKTRKQVVTRDGDVVWITEKKEHDNVARSALALQGLQWSLGHLKPKKHGPKATGVEEGKNAQLQGLIAAINAGPVRRK